MQKHEIEIAGYKITKLSDTEFEAENLEQNLDFFIEKNDEDEFDVFVFDSKIKCLSGNSNTDPLVFNFQCDTLEDAVKDAMEWKAIPNPKLLN